MGFYLDTENIASDVLDIHYQFPLCISPPFPVPINICLYVLAQFVGATIVVLALTTITNVLVMNAHFRGLRGHRPPAWLRKLFLDWLARIVCMRKVVPTFD